MTFLKRQWFLIALAVVLVVGLVFPKPFASFASMRVVRDLIVGTVLFLTTLPLATRAIGATLKRPTAAVLAVLINFGVLPAVAIVISRWLDGDWATGLIVAAAAPCTIASAAVWTRRAEGNDVVALMVTVVTNALCFLVTPLWLTHIASESDVSIAVGPMISKLALLVFLPMLLGQLLRTNRRIAGWSTAHKQMLGTLAQTGLLSIVFVGAVHCGLHLQSAETDQSGFAVGFAKMLIAVTVLHTSMLWLGQVLGRMIGLSRPDWIAVGFAGSQKTLMVGLQVALMVGGGLTILPMVAYHVSQLVVDTIVADRLRQK